MLRYTSLALLLLAAMIALGGGRGTARAAGEAPGPSADDWRQIASQLPSPVEVARLTAGDPGGSDEFGRPIGVSGRTVVVGSSDEDGGVGDPRPGAGAAYVFERDAGGSGNWGQVAKLVASDGQTFDIFGGGVAISGNTIVVGAQGEDGGPGDPHPNAGAAYVFERNAGGTGNWGQVRILRADDLQSGDRFGLGVAISGNTIVIGAALEDGGAGNLLPDAGAAYVFERNLGGPNNWGQVARLSATDAQPEDRFGISVGIAGDTIVVGADQEDGAVNLLPDAGAAYVFSRHQGGPNSWGQVKKLTTGERDAGDRFGFSVSISGEIIAVGAPSEDGGAGDPRPDAGAAYIFGRSQGGANNWGRIGRLSADDAQAGDAFGEAVTINGSTIVVGAWQEDGGPGDPLLQAGATYVYERGAGTSDWGQVARLSASDGQPGDIFGAAVAVSGGRTILVGAPNEDGGPGDPLDAAGAAYLFCLEDDFEENDGFGSATVITPGTLSDLQICAGDPDYYTLAATAGETIALDLNFLHAEGNLDLRLYGPGQNLLAVSVSTTDDESIDFQAPTTGFYFVQVAGAAGGEINRYTLTAAVGAAGSDTFLPLLTTGGP